MRGEQRYMYPILNVSRSFYALIATISSKRHKDRIEINASFRFITAGLGHAIDCLHFNRASAKGTNSDE